MRDLTCTFSQIKSFNMFSMYLQSGVSRNFPLKIQCGLNIEPNCFHINICHCWPQTLVAICRNMGIWDVFTLCSPGKIYLGFILLKSFISQGKAWFILQIHGYGCWWPGPTRSQGINSLGTAIVILRYSGFSTRMVNSLRLRQNGRHFSDDIFKCIFLTENVWIWTLKFVTQGLINKIHHWFR